VARRSEKFGIQVRVLGLAAGALVMAALVIWAGYRFSVQPLSQIYENPQADLTHLGLPSPLSRATSAVISLNAPVAAPALLKGITDDLRMNALSMPSYLLGDIRDGGWWYFFVVCLAVKTPIPFLVLSLLGIFWVWNLARESGNWKVLAPVASALAILMVTMPVKINLGTRHVLAVYPLLAPIAAYGAQRLAAIRVRVRVRHLGVSVALVLLLWQASSVARAHGDHFAYFNELAGKHPEDVLLWGCDLECGQDIWQLSRTLHERGITRLSLAIWTSADLSRMGLPPFEVLKPYEHPTGWIAVSIRMARTGEAFLDVGPEDAFAWISSYTPVTRVGNTINLYYIPPRTEPAH
jgi:hypothetical protein